MRTNAAIFLASLALFACDDDKKAGPAAPPSSAPARTASAPAKASASAAPSASASASAGVATVASPLDKACDDAAGAICARLLACIPSTKSEFADEATCRTRTALACTTALKAPDVATTADDVTACAKKVAAMACESLDLDGIPECRWHGKRAEGQPCGDDAQCASGHCDNRASQSRCGKCVGVAKEGEACDAKKCDVGLLCGAGAKCLKPAQLGDACSATKPCDKASCVAGKCVAFAHLGDACDPQAKTAPDCRRTIAECDAKTKKCVPEALYDKKPGEACMTVEGGTDVGCIGGFCGADKKCVAQAIDGAACKQHDDCLAPASCIAGTCKVVDPASCK